MAEAKEDLCGALQMYLTRMGYRTIKANAGQEALCAVQAVQKEAPPIVLSGTGFPDMDGFELLRRIKGLCPEAEVIMMLPREGTLTGIQYLQADASDWIGVPISSEALKVALQRAHARRSTRLKLEEYRRKVEDLERTKALYEQLFDEVPCYISVQDGNFRLTGANKQFKRDFGDCIGSHCYEIYKHRRKPCRDCPVESTFEDGQPHQTEEVVTALSGEQYHVITWTAPIRDASGAITQVMEMSTNITQIRRLQDRLTSLGLLLGSMSHGIRGMLTALDGGIYRLESGMEKSDPARVHSALEVIKGMVDRIKKTVLNILYFTKERQLNWQRVEVLGFSEEVCLLAEARADKCGVQFACEMDRSPGSFEIDPGALSSALVSLLENAIDACLADRSTGKTHKVVFRLRGNESHVVFDTFDNGAGMDRETREKLFTLFFSSKGSLGTGLGLYLAKQVVEQHGGTITVYSDPGQGSHFRVSLPRVLPGSVKWAPKSPENQG